jgi:hypothetical protein
VFEQAAGRDKGVPIIFVKIISKNYTIIFQVHWQFLTRNVRMVVYLRAAPPVQYMYVRKPKIVAVTFFWPNLKYPFANVSYDFFLS